MRKHFAISLIVTIIAVPALAIVTAYQITTAGPGSICISEGGWSNKSDKINGARHFIESYDWPHEIIKSNLIGGINSSVCCTVSKGNAEEPRLGLSEFIVSGKTHYIHVPTYNISTKRSDIELISVDGCGTGISAGVDI